MKLRQKIETEIRQQGPIPFSRYMELCLYDPELGYYSRAAEQFGKAGDFFTSSDVHAVFGRLLARQFQEMWCILDMPPTLQLIELGPGRGLFAQDVLSWSGKKYPDFFHALHYKLLESSPALQAKIRNTLASYLESGKARLGPLQADQEPSRPATNKSSEQATSGISEILASNGPVIIFANEFFDALPVEIISSQGKLQIDIQRGRFVETWANPTAEEMFYLDRFSVHPEPGEWVEAPLVAQEYMRRIAESLKHGFVVAVDYGYTREELLAGRHRGTVMAYRRHSASANPFEAPGEQDITAHVNFTNLAKVARQQGMQVENLITQSQFLMGIGESNQFADAFEECRLPQEKAKVALQLKHLVTPAGMGETFHVLIASRGVAPTKIAELSGLQFIRSRL